MKRKKVIYTIGHSNYSAEKFLSLLERTGIDVIIDVRSVPYSGANPQFNQGALRTSLAKDGVVYFWAGRELGGKAVRERGPEQLKRSAAMMFAKFGGRRAALMCAEENPSACHRKQFLAPLFSELGARVVHVRRDRGEEKSRRSAEPAGEAVQTALF